MATPEPDPFSEVPLFAGDGDPDDLDYDACESSSESDQDQMPRQSARMRAAVAQEALMLQREADRREADRREAAHSEAAHNENTPFEGARPEGARPEGARPARPARHEGAARPRVAQRSRIGPEDPQMAIERDGPRERDNPTQGDISAHQGAHASTQGDTPTQGGIAAGQGAHDSTQVTDSHNRSSATIDQGKLLASGSAQGTNVSDNSSNTLGHQHPNAAASDNDSVVLIAVKPKAQDPPRPNLSQLQPTIPLPPQVADPQPQADSSAPRANISSRVSPTSTRSSRVPSVDTRRPGPVFRRRPFSSDVDRRANIDPVSARGNSPRDHHPINLSADENTAEDPVEDSSAALRRNTASPSGSDDSSSSGTVHNHVLSRDCDNSWEIANRYMYSRDFGTRTSAIVNNHTLTRDCDSDTMPPRSKSGSAVKKTAAPNHPTALPMGDNAGPAAGNPPQMVAPPAEEIPRPDEWPMNCFTSLESYLSSRKDDMSEVELLYTLGVQAGIGHGIAAYRNNILAEMARTQKIFNLDVQFHKWPKENLQTPIESMQSCSESFDAVASMEAALNYIDVRSRVPGQAIDFAKAHRNGIKYMDDGTYSISYKTGGVSRNEPAGRLQEVLQFYLQVQNLRRMQQRLDIGSVPVFSSSANAADPFSAANNGDANTDAANNGDANTDAANNGDAGSRKRPFSSLGDVAPDEQAGPFTFGSDPTLSAGFDFGVPAAGRSFGGDNPYASGSGANNSNNNSNPYGPLPMTPAGAVPYGFGQFDNPYAPLPMNPAGAAPYDFGLVDNPYAPFPMPLAGAAPNDAGQVDAAAHSDSLSDDNTPAAPAAKKDTKTKRGNKKKASTGAPAASPAPPKKAKGKITKRKQEQK